MIHTPASAESQVLHIPFDNATLNDAFTVFERLTAANLDLVHQANEVSESLPPALNHLLCLREMPGLSDDRYADAYRGTPDITTPVIQSYRAGVYLGASLINAHGAQFGFRPQWPAVSVGRKHLQPLDNPTHDRLSFRLDARQEQERQGYFLHELTTGDHAVDASVFGDRLTELAERWTHPGFVLADGGSSYHDLPGYLYNGVAHALRLNRLLRYEEQAAPRSSVVFDPDLHIPVPVSLAADNMTTQAALIARGMQVSARGGMTELGCRDIIEGVRYTKSDAANPGTLATSEQTRWGRAELQPGERLTHVTRAVVGYVVAEVGSHDVIPVVFRASQETYGVEHDDIVVARQYKTFRELRYPFEHGAVPKPKTASEQDIMAVADASDADSLAFMTSSFAFLENRNASEPYARYHHAAAPLLLAVRSALGRP